MMLDHARFVDGCAPLPGEVLDVRAIRVVSGGAPVLARRLYLPQRRSHGRQA